jgi:hypothetical protein
MLVVIHELRITGDLWLHYCGLYEDMNSQVKWASHLSRTITELQGVRQGGIPSTELFKARGNGILDTLSASQLGYTIGSVDVSAPTCADDMTLISGSPIDLQVMINLAVNDSCRERYGFSSNKYKVMVMNNHNKAWMEKAMWNMGDKHIDTSDFKYILESQGHRIVRPVAQSK